MIVNILGFCCGFLFVYFGYRLGHKVGYKKGIDDGYEKGTEDFDTASQTGA